MKKNILLTGFLAGALVLGFSVQIQAMKEEEIVIEEKGDQKAGIKRRRDGGLYNSDFDKQGINPKKRQKIDGQTTQQNSGTNSGTQSNTPFVLGNDFQQSFSLLVPEDNNGGFFNYVKSIPGRLREGFKAFFMNQQVNRQVNNQQVNQQQIKQTQVINQQQQQVNQQPIVRYDVQAFQDACNGVKNLAGRNLRGASLAGRNLEDVDFTGADLTEADLRGANLNRVRLVNTILPRVHLERLDERQTHMEDAFIFKSNMSGAHLEGCFLNRSKIIDTNLRGAFFADAEINDALFVSVRLPGPVIFHDPKYLSAGVEMTGSGMFFTIELLPNKIPEVQVQKFVPGFPAFEAGLRKHDKIIEVDGTPFDQNDNLTTIGKKLNGRPGGRVRLRIIRAGVQQEFSVPCIAVDYFNLVDNAYKTIFTENNKQFLREVYQSIDRTLVDMVNLAKTDLSGAHFDNTRLNRTIIAGVDLSHATFTEMTLENTKILDSNLQNVTLNRIRAEGVMIFNCNASRDINRNHTILQDVIFSNNSKIYNTDFSFARITRSREGDVEGEGLSFIYSSLEHVKMQDIVSSKMDFSGTELKNIDFRRAKLNNLTMIVPPVYSENKSLSFFGFNLNFEGAFIANARFFGNKVGKNSRTTGMQVNSLSGFDNVLVYVQKKLLDKAGIGEDDTEYVDKLSSLDVMKEFGSAFYCCNFSKATLIHLYCGYTAFYKCTGLDNSDNNGVINADRCLFHSCQLLVSAEHLKLFGAKVNGYCHPDHVDSWEKVDEKSFLKDFAKMALGIILRGF
ncbi:MAG: pentapeptide repeat-containing protein [bacterium]